MFDFLKKEKSLESILKTMFKESLTHIKRFDEIPADMKINENGIEITSLNITIEPFEMSLDSMEPTMPRTYLRVMGDVSKVVSKWGVVDPYLSLINAAKKLEKKKEQEEPLRKLKNYNREMQIKNNSHEDLTPES